MNLKIKTKYSSFTVILKIIVFIRDLCKSVQFDLYMYGKETKTRKLQIDVFDEGKMLKLYSEHPVSWDMLWRYIFGKPGFYEQLDDKYLSFKGTQWFP